MDAVAYPFHESMKAVLPIGDSPLFVMRLMRRVMFDLGVTDIEAELLIGLASRSEPASFDDVCEIIPHFTEDRTKRLIKRAGQSGLVEVISSDDDHGFSYMIKPFIVSRLQSFDKSSLQ